jgi:hypothetical protein
MTFDSHNLFDDFELSGFWWLPTNPDNQVPGVLRYSAGDRMTLELFGSLQAWPDTSHGDSDTDIILGLAEGTRILTLQKLIRTNAKSTGKDKVYRSSYIAHRLFEGKHFASAEDIKFSSISISYTSLEDWVTDCPYNLTDEADTSSEIMKFTVSHLVPYPLFESRIGSLNSKICGALRFEHSIGIRTLNWESTGYIEIIPDEPASFEWFWQVHSDIRNLLTLFMNEPTYAKKIEAAGVSVEVLPDRVVRERISVYVLNSSGASKREIHPADMLLIFPTIKDSFPKILDGWFSKAEALRPVHTLFFGSMYFSSMFPRFHFLNLIQAVETYHRDMRAGEYLSKTEFEPIRQVIVQAIPEGVPRDFRDSLKNKIGFGYEYALRKRIHGLLKELEDQTVQLLTKKVNDFVGSMVDTRNYFTHYPPELKKTAFSGDELHYANYKLRVLLIILLLKEAGLEETLIRKAICGNNELVYGLSEGRGGKAFRSEHCQK